LIKRLGIKLLPKGRAYQQFVILCTARTGSTWLHTLLNSNLYIHSQGEIVRENHESKKLPFERFAFGRFPKFVKAVGLKIFYDLPAYQEALEYVLLHKHFKVILLTRESSIAQFISYKKANHSGQWSYSKASSKSTLQVDFDEFLAYKEKMQTELIDLRKRLRNHHVYELTYEELITNRETILDKLQLFLGVPQKKLRSLLQKQSKLPIGKQIENWDEIKNKL